MAELHHSLGTSGLRLRTERGVQALALANLGPLIGNAYATAADLEAAEAGRVVAEVALDLPGRLCLALDDGGTLLPRNAGDPNPRYTIYRVVPVPLGTEPEIRWGTAERLDALIDLCEVAATWLLAEPTYAATLDDDCAALKGWTLVEPRLAGKLDDSLDTRTGWTIAPDSVPGSGTTTGGGDLGQTTTAPKADITYPEQIATDWAAADTGGWRTALRWWANSHGPFTAAGTAPEIAEWQTLWPGVRWSAYAWPYYYRTRANARGAVSCPPSRETELNASAQVGFRTEQAWTLFVVAQRSTSPAQTSNGVLFSAGFTATQAAGTPAYDLELLSGSTTEGIAIAWGSQARRTFATALSTSAFQIVEVWAAAGSAVGTWAAAINNTALTEAAITNGTAVPTAAIPNAFRAFRGWENSVGAPFRGDIAEIILLQTDAAAVRSAVRSYLASKFAITLS